MGAFLPTAEEVPDKSLGTADLSNSFSFFFSLCAWELKSVVANFVLALLVI